MLTDWQPIRLGASDVQVPPLGIGTWQWGDRLVWGYGGDFSESDVDAAFRASVEAGVRLFDTAEIYGLGASERILGRAAARLDTPVVLATKFMPLPWRLTGRSVRSAIEASARRLGVERIDVYIVHFPPRVLTEERLMDALAEAVRDGLVGAVGTSNYSATQLESAYEALKQRGVPLATNQAKYSLLDRTIERDGVLDTAQRLGVTTMAASPLAKGLLTGKYGPGRPPPGTRRFIANRERLATAGRVADLLREIGGRVDRTPSQVALNWLVTRGNVIPIPGAKNVRQAQQNTGALGWTLDQSDIAALDNITG
jgi:aryl-alcohol dehydrogenase-like predicted oxidoreductase